MISTRNGQQGTPSSMAIESLMLRYKYYPLLQVVGRFFFEWWIFQFPDRLKHRNPDDVYNVDNYFEYSVLILTFIGLVIEVVGFLLVYLWMNSNAKQLLLETISPRQLTKRLLNLSDHLVSIRNHTSENTIIENKSPFVSQASSLDLEDMNIRKKYGDRDSSQITNIQGLNRNTTSGLDIRTGAIDITNYNMTMINSSNIPNKHDILADYVDIDQSNMNLSSLTQLNQQVSTRFPEKSQRTSAQDPVSMANKSERFTLNTIISSSRQSIGLEAPLSSEDFEKFDEDDLLEFVKHYSVHVKDVDANQDNI